MKAKKFLSIVDFIVLVVINSQKATSVTLYWTQQTINAFCVQSVLKKYRKR